MLILFTQNSEADSTDLKALGSLFASCTIIAPISATSMVLSGDLSVLTYNIGSYPPALTALTGLSVVAAGFFNTDGSVVRYLFTLTGAADGTTDIEIPISSFQCRMRSGDPTYLSVVIPTVDYATQIAARANGTLKVDMAYKKDGEYLQRETIIQADLEDVSLDEGSDSQSVTLTGHKTETFTGKAITLEKSVYRSIKDGKVRHRIAKPNIYLRPGDTVTVDSDTFIADTVSYVISVDSKTMEVAEA